MLSLATTAGVHFADIADPSTGQRMEPNLVGGGQYARAEALPHGCRSVDGIVFPPGCAVEILGIEDVRRLNGLMKRPMLCDGDAQTLDGIRKAFNYAFDPATHKGGGLPLLEVS